MASNSPLFYNFNSGVPSVCLPQTTSSILHADSMTNVLVYVEWKYQQSLQQCPTCGGELT